MLSSPSASVVSSWLSAIAVLASVPVLISDPILASVPAGLSAETASSGICPAGAHPQARSENMAAHKKTADFFTCLILSLLCMFFLSLL